MPILVFGGRGWGERGWALNHRISSPVNLIIIIIMIKTVDLPQGAGFAVQVIISSGSATGSLI